MRVLVPVAHLDASVTVPGSKSLTQRALIAAALATGPSRLRHPLASEDTRYTMEALRAMGVACDDTNPEEWLIHGTGGKIAVPDREIFLGNNGTATRFLTSLAALGQGEFRISGSERMRERPISPLMEALSGWGVDIVSEEANGCPPLRIRAGGLAGGQTILPEGKSSQYLSSLLLVAPYAREETEIEVRGEVLSKPYVLMTLSVMADFGVCAEASPTLALFRVPRGSYQPRDYTIESDVSGASYFWGAAAITGGRVRVEKVSPLSLQGDIRLLPCLARMGCRVEQVGDGILVAGTENLCGIRVDMGDMPDVAPTLAVVAAFAEGDTVIENIAHLRIKECDRIAAVVMELRKLGAEVEEKEDGMVIHGRRGGENLHGARIHTYQDHRIAMSFAMAGLRLPGVEIEGPECVAKSFPDFWERVCALGAASSQT